MTFAVAKTLFPSQVWVCATWLKLSRVTPIIYSKEWEIRVLLKK